jgi:BirA family transcriptional regulator, biotin operon repressor / biotin---[acetyl-CoA-carboxylase] ligase
VQDPPADAYSRDLDAELPIAGLGVPLRYIEAVGSTNDEALAWAREGVDEGAIVVADHQSAGRGRRGRIWHAAPGTALLFSLVLRPTLGPDHLGLLTTALGVAGAEASRSFGLDARVKWPNDVTVAGKKLAGILVESRLSGHRVEAAIAGMGFNVSVAPRDLPPGVGDGATSIAAELGESPSRAKVLKEILAAFMDHYESLASDAGRARLIGRARDLSAILGTTVSVSMGDGSVTTGEAIDLTATGALVIETADGRLTVSAGEIETLRPV